MRRARQCRVILLALVCSSCASLPSVARLTGETRDDGEQGLQVPYVAQTELLCGGAALAMVERWWGRRSVRPEQFAYLVRRDEGGIRTTDLADLMRARGWVTDAGTASPTKVRASLTDSAPVIALIRVAPRRLHYVVIVRWDSATVSYHDPAVGPAMTVATSEFLTRWDGTHRWALFVRPSPDAGRITAAAPPPAIPIQAVPLPCQAWMDRAADASESGALADAERALDSASTACPGEPRIIRERAGVRFRQRRYADAAQLAASYLRHAPMDTLGRQLLASSHYLSGDPIAALAAWNTIGRPVVDLIRIDGTRHVRFRALESGIDVHAPEVLTVTRLMLARRRLDDIPAVERSRVSYEPVAGGMVELRATVSEHPRIAPVGELLVAGAVRAAVRREVIVELATPLGAGERWSALWRWRPADQRLALRLDIPIRLRTPAVLHIERSRERWRYTAGVRDARRDAAALGISGWLHPALEHRLSARLDDWSDDRRFLALTAGAGLHAADDRLSLLAEGEHGVPFETAAAYDRVSGQLRWRPPADRWSNTWSMRGGVDFASAQAPTGLWPLAGGGLTLAIPLRAHPWILDDRLPAARIGRMITHGGVAVDRSLVTVGQVAIGGGAFLDAANVAARLDGAAGSRFHLDAGAGVHVGVVGVPWASIRLDLARGLAADRRWGVSAALAERPIPRLGRLH